MRSVPKDAPQFFFNGASDAENILNTVFEFFPLNGKLYICVNKAA